MRVITVRTDDIPADAPLDILQSFPHKEVRMVQAKILHLFQKFGKSYTNFFIQAPPGVGKSAISKAICDYTIRCNPSAKTIIMVGRKQLLYQYAAQYALPILMGQGEYKCLATPFIVDPDKSGRQVNFDVAPCKYIARFTCPHDIRNHNKQGECEDDYITLRGLMEPCVYLNNRRIVEHSPSCAVSSLTALYLDRLKGRSLLVWDEADNAFDDLVKYFSLELDEEYFFHKYKIRFDRRKVEDIQYWDTFIVTILREMEQDMNALRQKLLDTSLNEDERVKIHWKIFTLEQRVGEVENVRSLLMEKRHNIVIRTNNEEDNPPDFLRVEFAPISVAALSDTASTNVITSIAPIKVFIGATLNPKILVRQLGLSDEQSIVIDYERHPFPVDHRIVKFIPCGSMSRAKKEATLPKLLHIIEIILAKNQGKPGLILPNSKWLRDRIMNHFAGTKYHHRLMTHESGMKSLNKATTKWEASKDSVLVSTYISMGFDGHHGRFIIIPKVPFPNLKDPWVRARRELKYGDDEYNWNAIKDIIQKSGRCTRSPADVSTTYVLDSDFGNLLSRYTMFFPEWFRQAIRFHSSEPRSSAASNTVSVRP